MWGWCLKQRDFRLFKLNRLEELKKSEDVFHPREVPLPDLSDEKIFPGEIKVKALFEPDMKWRLVEEFGMHCFTETEDKKLLFTVGYKDVEHLIGWLLTFGSKVKVLEPVEIKDGLRNIAESIRNLYKEE